MRRLISTLVAGAAVVLLASSSAFVVDQHRFGVLDGLGAPREVVATPGLHFKLPAPLQHVVYLDKRLQTLDTADGERFATGDKRELVVDAFVKWKIVDARQYLIALAGGNADRGNDRMAQIVRTALSVEVADVRLKRIDFADSANTAVIERMKAERVRMAAATRAGGVADADQIRGDAERQRGELLAEAQRDAESIRGDGDAKAAQIYAQSYGKNPEFYRFYRSMEAYKATFKGRSDILVLDANSEFFKYFKGPGAGK
jgi:membrane protease subunit HflC